MSIAPQIYADYAGMCAAVADRVIEVVRHNPHAVIGLSTGGTPLGIYRELVRRQQENPTDFSRVRFFQLDEYVGLPSDHPQSYHTYLWDNLLRPLGAKPENVFIPEGAAADLNAAAAQYETALRDAGGVDLWIIGLGPKGNGHIAFNEPGSDLDSRTRVITLSEQTHTANAPNFEGTDTQMPTQALTAGLGTIREYAKEVAFIVNGPHKAEILADVMNTTQPDSRIPASVLHGLNTIGYFDAAAAAQLAPDLQMEGHANALRLGDAKGQGVSRA